MFRTHRKAVAVMFLIGISIFSVAIFIKYAGVVAASIHYGVVDQKLKESWHVAKAAVSSTLERLRPREPLRIEDANERNSLPLYRTIAALTSDLMAPHVPSPSATAWHRSSSDNTSAKHAHASLITKENVDKLQIAWTYSTPIASANIQATPVYTGRAVVFPDARGVIVALDPANGGTLWQFDPKIPRPAMRGLVFVPAHGDRVGLIFFAARGRLFALEADSGVPHSRFGGGSVAVGYDVKAAPAIWRNFVIVSSAALALHAFDITSGQPAWTVTTQPGDGTEEARSYSGGMNWGGFSVDDRRGFAFLTTSNPSPVGYGGRRPGRNPGTSAIVAVDLVGRRIAWEFQEIAHDLWDLDIAAAPVLATILREGKPFDVVVAATKAGNIIVLDRVKGRPVFDYRLRRAPASTVPGEATHPYQPDPELPEPAGRFEFSIADVTDIGERNRRSVMDQLTDATFGFYAPHVPERLTVFFGLHGGTTHFGPALDPSSQTLVVAVNREPSSFSITSVTEVGDSGSDQQEASSAFSRHCASCHGRPSHRNTMGPSLKNVARAMTRGDIERIVRSGFRTMPAIPNISKRELTEILDALFALPKQKSEATLSSTPRSTDYVRTPYTKLKDFEGYPGSRPPWGVLHAVDLNSGRTRWTVPLGHFEELLGRGLPATGTPNFAGPMTTASELTFVSGTKDRLIRAFDTRSGTQLWAHQLPHIGSATPMTYIHKGRQYVLIPSTGGGTLAIYDRTVTTGSDFVAFSLPQ